MHTQQLRRALCSHGRLPAPCQPNRRRPPPVAAASQRNCAGRNPRRTSMPSLMQMSGSSIVWVLVLVAHFCSRRTGFLPWLAPSSARRSRAPCSAAFPTGGSRPKSHPLCCSIGPIAIRSAPTRSHGHQSLEVPKRESRTRDPGAAHAWRPAVLHSGHVHALAKILTGWTVIPADVEADPAPIYVHSRMHDPGRETVDREHLSRLRRLAGLASMADLAPAIPRRPTCV